MSKNNQQTRKPEPPAEHNQPAEPADPPTTIRIKAATKSRLDLLKEIMKTEDFDALVNRLIDNLPSRLSTEAEVHLVMPASKYRWLLAKQDTCDCRNCLNDSRV